MNTTNNNAAPKLRPVPTVDPPPPPGISGAVAGFIVCTLTGLIVGFLLGFLAF